MHMLRWGPAPTKHQECRPPAIITPPSIDVVPVVRRPVVVAGCARCVGVGVLVPCAWASCCRGVRVGTAAALVRVRCRSSRRGPFVVCLFALGGVPGVVAESEDGTALCAPGEVQGSSASGGVDVGRGHDATTVGATKAPVPPDCSNCTNCTDWAVWSPVSAVSAVRAVSPDDAPTGAVHCVRRGKPMDVTAIPKRRRARLSASEECPAASPALRMSAESALPPWVYR